MLQRIQTVFLLLVAILMGLSLAFPIWSYNADGSDVFHTLSSFYYEGFSSTSTQIEKVFFPFSLVATLAIASVTITIIEITKFKDRLLQMKLGALNALLMAAAMGLSVYFATDLMKVKEVAGAYGIGLFLPGAAMICNVIANRFIRKDEKLVRSVDRIR